MSWSRILQAAARSEEAWAELEATAHHEAGHAVVGLLVGAKVRRLQVYAQLEDGRVHSIGGRAYFEFGRVRGADPDLTDAAGFVAEALFTRGDTAGTESEADFARIARRTRLRPGQVATAPAAAIAGARTILTRRWPAVKAVASALLLAGALEGLEVEAIMRRSCHGPRPAA